MRKLRLVWIGKTHLPFVKTGIEIYQKKISNYIKIDSEEIKPSQYSALNLEECRSQETKKFLKIMNPSEVNIFLDVKGERKSSVSLANWIEKKIMVGRNRINFFIGGAYGFEKSLLPLGVYFLSLSDMTFPHQLVRLILLEQIYRAFTLINREPYHHL